MCVKIGNARVWRYMCGSERSAKVERRRRVNVWDKRRPVANKMGGRRIFAALAVPSAGGDGTPSRIRQTVAAHPFL